MGLHRIHHLWDEAECRMCTRSYRPTSVANLNNALVAEWEKIPAASFQKPCGKSYQSEKETVMDSGCARGRGAEYRTPPACRKR